MTPGLIKWKKQLAVNENIFLMASNLCAKVSFCMLIGIDTIFNQLPGEHSMKNQLNLRDIIM